MNNRDAAPTTGIGVKRPGLIDRITKEEFENRVRNIAHSKRDIAWWAEQFFHIVTLDLGLTKIKLYPKQKEMLQFLIDNNRSIVLASRQTGKCVFKDVKILLRNKKTGKIEEITIGDFFDRIKNSHNKRSFIPTNPSKFIESLPIDSYLIISDDGWKDCKAIHKTIRYQVWSLRTSHHTLKCADDHIVFDKLFNKIFIKDLVVGLKIQCEDCLDEILDIQRLSFEDNMYDVELGDDSNHRYYSNGILSHNTTTYTVFCVWLTTLFAEKRVLICANKLNTAMEIMDRIRKAYEQLPSWIKPGILAYNKGEIVFENGSSVKAFSTSSSGARGSSGNVLVLDEFAFVAPNLASDFFASVIPIVSSSKNSKIIVVSTPNGASGLYYDLWQLANSKEAKLNKDGWQPFRIHWWDTGGIRDEQWKQQQIASIGLERWKQEFECDFLTSSTSRLIPDDIIERMRMELSELKIKSKEFYDGKSCKVISDKKDKVYEFTMWHEFDKDHTYAASGDVSDGTGGDTSVLYVWDITDLRLIKMCAKFASNQVSPMEFAFITNRILELYNKPYYICERNGVGAGYLDALRITYEYPRLVNEAKNGEVGVFSHNTVKMKACLWARDMMTTQGFGFKIYDKDLVEEFSTFCKKDTKGALLQYAALAKCHDDHVMAFCWLCRLLNPEVIEKYYIVCTTFTSSIGNVFPLIVHPLELYTDRDLKKVSDDPVYQDFLEFKEKMLNKFLNLMNEERNASKNDYMFLAPLDIYFGGDDGPSWNCPTLTSFNPTTVSPYNSVPTFFIS